jgi:hypothetical protein
VGLTGTSPFNQPVTYYSSPTDAALPQVTARTPAAVILGTPMPNQNFPAPLASNLYTFTSAAMNQVMLAQFSNLGVTVAGNVAGALAPASGQFSAGQPFDAPFYDASMQSVALALLPTVGTYYVSTFAADKSGAVSGYGHTLKIQVLNATSFSAKETGGPDSVGMPVATIANLPTATPYYAVDGAINSAGDVDWIQYTTPAPQDVVVQVVTVNGSETTFTLSPNCVGTLIPRTYEGPVASYADTTVSGNLTHCIGISISQLGPTPTYPIPYTVILASP